MKSYTYTSELWDLSEAGVLDVEVSTNEIGNIKKLLSGRIDLYPIGKIAADNLIRQNFSEQERSRIVYAQKPLIQVDGFVLFSRAYPSADALAAEFEAALNELRDQGLLDE